MMLLPDLLVGRTTEKESTAGIFTVDVGLVLDAVIFPALVWNHKRRRRILLKNVCGVWGLTRVIIMPIRCH